MTKQGLGKSYGLPSKPSTEANPQRILARVNGNSQCFTEFQTDTKSSLNLEGGDPKVPADFLEVQSAKRGRIPR